MGMAREEYNHATINSQGRRTIITQGRVCVELQHHRLFARIGQWAACVSCGWVCAELRVRVCGVPTVYSASRV
jgi:hypothetical protein